MKDLKATLPFYRLKELLAEGEHEQQDFKVTVNDARKIARTLSAFANKSGGRLLIGVDDNGIAKGIRSEEDIFVVEAAASIYCEPPCEISFSMYKITGGGGVLRVDVKEADKKPLYVKETANVKKVYWRVKDENIVAHPLLVKSWRNASALQNAVFSPDESHISLLRKLDSGGMPVDQLLQSVAMSRGRFEQTIVRLFDLGLIKFEYQNHKYSIKLK